jgi:hypothetical protein
LWSRNPFSDYIPELYKIFLIEIFNIYALSSKQTINDPIFFTLSLDFFYNFFGFVVLESPSIDLAIKRGRSDHWIGRVPGDVSGCGEGTRRRLKGHCFLTGIEIVNRDLAILGA